MCNTQKFFVIEHNEDDTPQNSVVNVQTRHVWYNITWWETDLYL